MAAQEVITIQCGHYSNFIGTHWLNMQEAAFNYDRLSKEPQEILNDCMFREGITLTGEQTYLPRLIAVDLSGSLKSLKAQGELYDVRSDTVPWTGNVEEHVSDPLKKNEFLSDLDQLEAGKIEEEDMECQEYDLQDNVDVWSDFLRLHLHPKSVLTVPGFFHNDESFGVYPAGLEALENKEFMDSFEDRLHFFAEECDHLQGFHLLVDHDTGFGAVGSHFAQEIADEFGSKGLLSIISSPLVTPLDQTGHYHTTLLNHALTLHSLTPPCSLVTPLSLNINPWRTCGGEQSLRNLPNLNFKSRKVVRRWDLYHCDQSEESFQMPSLHYHSAAVFASAMETISLLYRTEHAQFTTSSLADTLTHSGRKLCSMGLCLPFPLPLDSCLLSELDHTPLHHRLHPLTPFCTLGEDTRWSQAISMRGIPHNYPTCFPQDPCFSQCRDHPSVVLGQHLSQYFDSSRVQSSFSVVQKPLAISTPFPAILSPDYHKENQAAVCASLHTESGLGQLLTSLLAELNSIQIKRFTPYTSSCLDQDNWTELLHELSMLSDKYKTTMCSEDIDSD